MMNSWPRFGRYALWCGLVLAFLALGAELIVPRVIAAAYRGESVEVLNRILAGRGQHPLDDYLTVWHRLSRIALAWLVVFVGFVALWNLKIAALARRILRAHPDLRPRQVIWLSAWFGALGGIGEAALPLARQLIERHPARYFAWEAIWMAPLASIVAFLFMGVLTLAVTRASGGTKRWLAPVAVQSAVFCFSALAVYGILSQPIVRLANMAAVILSLGLAAWLGRRSADSPAGLMRLVRTSSGPIAVLLLLSTALGIWMLPSPLERRRLARLGEADDQPNVLLIILDTVRAPSMSLYGYGRRTTPNLDRIARDGVVFDRAIATAAWTLPSHASIFTGLYPHDFSADIGIPLDRAHPVLAEVLTGQGYATAAFVANYAYTTEASGLARGFARYEDFPIDGARFFRSSWLAEAIVTRVVRLRHWRDRKLARIVTDDFLRWQADHSDRPFFAFLNYIDAHYHYSSEPPFNTMFGNPGDPPKLVGKREGITMAELEGARSAYDNAIAYTDAALGRLLDELDRRGVLDNTVVVVSSDHGEHLGEHGLQEHTNSLYMPLIHVPLLVVYPRLVPSGLRVGSPVSIRDIPSTLLELAGSTSSVELAGSSLSRYWSGANDTIPPTADPILSELNYWGVVQKIIMPWDPVFLGPMKSVVLGNLHYIRNGRDQEEVYDLLSDPDELVDLSETLEEYQLVRLRSALDSMIAGH